MKFNERFKELRHSKKLTQKQMAENQCQRYECGSTLPTVPGLILIADFFNVSLDYLVGRDVALN